MALVQTLRAELGDAHVLSISQATRAVQPYAGWGGYGSSKLHLNSFRQFSRLRIRRGEFTGLTRGICGL